MKYKLIAPVQQNYSPVEQVLHNRGIEDINKYLKSSIKDINSPHELNSIQLRNGLAMLAYHIARNDKTAIIIDPDVDGNTASALLLNYLYNLYPTFVKNIQWIFHEGKQHGLNDCVDELLRDNYKLILCPDAGSNDTEACKKLKDNQCDVLILDHHDFDRENPYPVIINNQDHYSDYNNKFLSGVGVVWQFCRFIDETLGKDFANKYLDLVAIGNCGDMMSMRSIETKTLINEGLQHIQNPFIYHMAQKNAFKLGSKITSIGAAFYIVPLLNAIQRSGTQEEKKLAFASMLEFKAFEQVPSTKRGHKLGDTETIVEQAIRTCTNVKNRQTRVQDAAIDQLEKQIIDNNLLENCKVLILLLKQDSNVPAEVRGLIANKFMAK
jgi:single-stranded-DNA-specific exonuclease